MSAAVRAFAAGMLRENLPWTAEQITAWLGLLAKSLFIYHFMMGDAPVIRDIIKEICITE